MKLLSNDTADRFVGMAQRSRKIFGPKVGKIFAERRLLLAAEPFAIMCAYLISTDLYRGRHVPVCREPDHIRGNSARLFYRPETI